MITKLDSLPAETISGSEATPHVSAGSILSPPAPDCEAELYVQMPPLQVRTQRAKVVARRTPEPSPLLDHDGP
jgi:hypothetical protein